MQSKFVLKKSVNIFRLIIVLLFSAFNSKAQEFKIIAAEDGSALPFATIINLTQKDIVSANVNGVVSLSLQNDDSISVSYVGYKTNSFVYNSNVSTTIRLSKETVTLPSITIINCKKMKKEKIKNKDAVKWITNPSGIPSSFTGITWCKDWTNNIGALRLNSDKENTMLSSFSFWLLKGYRGPESAIKAPLIIRFYDVSDSLLPGNLIAENPIFYYPQKTGKQILHLDSLHLIIPPNGIYVTLQCVMNEEYAWKETIHFADSVKSIYKDSVYTFYGGRIEGMWTKQSELAMFSTFKNKWIRPSGLKTTYGIYATLKYEAVLKYCAD
jgi:hypothetical protein